MVISLYSEQFFVKKIGVSFLWFLFLAFAFNCQKCPTRPDGSNKIDQNFCGQLVSDIVKLILKPDGSVWAWGSGFQGTLGNGSLESSDVPVRVFRLRNIISIDADGGRGVAADIDGNIWFWGNNMWYYEEPGKDTVIVVPIRISKIEGIKKVQFLILDINILLDDGTIWTITTNPTSPSRKLTPYRKYPYSGIIQMSETVALRNDGTLLELLHTEPSRGGLTESIQDVIYIANVCNRRTIIIKSDSTVWAWGMNDYGQLGDGTYVQRTEPVQIDHLKDMIKISSNYDYNLGINRDGKLFFGGLEKPYNKPPLGLAIPKLVYNHNTIELFEAFVYCLFMTSDGLYWMYDTNSEDIEQVLFTDNDSYYYLSMIFNYIIIAE